MSARARWRCLEGSLAAAALLTMAVPSAHAALSADPVMVGLVLNGHVLADNQLVHRDAGVPGRTWLATDLAARWRISLAGREQRQIEGVWHVALCVLPERCFYDESSALLTMSLPPQALQAQRIEPTPGAVPAAAQATGSGAYVNYDLAAWHIGRPGMSLLLEGRAYTPQGHGSLWLDSVAVRGAGTRSRAAALWQTDRPDLGLSQQWGNIQIPDTTFGAGPTVFGWRMGSNARLQPLERTAVRPQLMAAGTERAVRADVFVDGLYRQTAEVPYGPYVVEAAPTHPGRGEMTVVTTDVTGQQSRVALPYYAAPDLLEPGRQVWSVDLGLAAAQAGRLSRHDPPLASASLRHGVDRATTVQLNGLASRGVQRLAWAADTADSQLGLTSFSLVLQRSPSRPAGGAWLGIGHEILARTAFLSARGETAMHGCSPLAAAVAATGTDLVQRPCRRLSWSAGAELGAGWSASAASSLQREDQGRDTAVRFVGLRWQAGSERQLSIGHQQVVVGGLRRSSLTLNWSQPLSGPWASQSGLRHRPDRGTSATWAVQSAAAPGDPNTQRWAVQGQAGSEPDLAARVADQGSFADWRLEARANRRGAQGSAGLAGAVGVADGRSFVSRRIVDAFIVVDVGLPDLPVLLDNREVARTNPDGWAVVTEARAHQTNVIGVDTAALPISYSMPRDQLGVVPALAAGALARFEVSDSGVALPVADTAGRPLPRGAAVLVSTQSLPTAITSRSEVFVDRSDRAADVRVNWPGGSCGFRYEPQQRLAAWTCAAP